jgi:hypothetical protein
MSIAAILLAAVPALNVPALNVPALNVPALNVPALTVPATVRWEAVASDPGGRYEIDSGSLVRNGDRVRLLMRAFPANPEAAGSDYAIIRYVVDCRQQSRALEAADFYHRDGSLASSRGEDGVAQPYEPIVAGSGDWQVMRRVCPGSRAR